MNYDRIREAAFVDRPNRFVARVEIGGKIERCHVRNTGRCREPFVSGARVYAQEAEAGPRKTGYDLIAVEKAGRAAGRGGVRILAVDCAVAPGRMIIRGPVEVRL